ncbi:hypothetical protein [Alloalcanivorax xenomutans]|uniref:hypothetical protein n=1 Tax=Alloalcanivorax xenomutans TaxID=1094342 RepID=UPI003BABC9E4
MAAQLPDIKPLLVAKREQFANEARALDAAKMARLEARKHYALAVTLIHHQYAQSLDDTAELLVKMVQQLASTAEQHLQTYQLEQRQAPDGPQRAMPESQGTTGQSQQGGGCGLSC